MNRCSLILATTVLAAVGAYASGENRIPRGLVGFTTATATGGSGVLTMTGLCQTEFPASRMCTSAEILATQSVPALPGVGVAWVQPTFVPTSATSDGTTLAVFGADASGVAPPTGSLSTSPTALTCHGWASSSGEEFGLVVDGAGRFGRVFCDENHIVACCAGQPELLGDVDRDGDLDAADSTLIRRFLSNELSALPLPG